MDKIKVLFVCYGNICRSPMAEFIFKDMVEKKGLSDRFYIESAATSREEIGNPVYYAAKEKLNEAGIDCSGKVARQIVKEDYDRFDYIIGMELSNIRAMMKVFGEDKDGKIHRLRDFTSDPGDIEDPWYTRNFDKVYEQICKGCIAFLDLCKTL